MTANDVPHLAQHLIAKHGLDALGWTFRWDNAKRRAGSCWWSRKWITLSRHYVVLNVAERPDEVVDTILHEIAHALAGHTAGHGPEWKAVCEQIGARPNRCYDTSEVVMPQGKYLAVCRGCRKEYRRHKQEKRGTWRYCAACGLVKGRLTYTATDAQQPTTLPTTMTQRDTTPTPKRLR